MNRQHKDTASGSHLHCVEPLLRRQRVYALMTTSADKGAVRDVSQLEK